MQACHSGTPKLDKASQELLRQASGLHRSTPPRDQALAQGAKPAGAKSSKAGRKASIARTESLAGAMQEPVSMLSMTWRTAMHKGLVR